MISPSRIPLPESFGTLTTGIPDLVAELLDAQQSLTAVERFSARHDAHGTDTESAFENKTFYRDLIPLRAPEAGEQYAFEVDLDRCTGCKACVTACHNLNGLDDDETWRNVGVLQKTAQADHLIAPSQTLKPVQQHVTTACHHCADPGCAQGCPTLAYEKDPATGVVRHLDDQCFGCQYCILKCPYDVPQYSAKRGIVRKCDLCVGRLRAGEAPACAQACPTQAIRVTLVETATLLSNGTAASAHFDLPGVPDPTRVKPTTRYITRRGLPLGMEAADASQIHAEHAHHPLTMMLVASQAAAGYWIMVAVMGLVAVAAGSSDSPSFAFPWLELIGVGGVQGALALSLLHLGRPWLAWKAVLGWRRSWLSREVIAFTALAASTGSYAALSLAEWFLGEEGMTFRFPESVRVAVAVGVLMSVAAAIYASAMVYRDTPRALWATRATLWRFGFTALLCGIPAWIGALQFFGSSTAFLPSGFAPSTLMLIIPPVMLVKLMQESSVLSHRDDGEGPLWKAAQLLLGTLRPLRAIRLFFGVTGGILLPFVSGIPVMSATMPGPSYLWTLIAAGLVIAGELLERHLFFVTAVAPRMPGGRQ